MARSVIITTPYPTLEELGKSLGLSKRRQEFLINLMRTPVSRGSVAERKKSASASVNQRPKVSRLKK